MALSTFIALLTAWLIMLTITQGLIVVALWTYTKRLTKLTHAHERTREHIARAHVTYARTRMLPPAYKGSSTMH